MKIKSKKVKLVDLKIKSVVMPINDKEAKTIIGGKSNPWNIRPCMED